MNEAIDFSSLPTQEILQTLQKYSIALTPEEILKIQHEILRRPPTLTECILWSIQGSEHCSYRSSRQHLKQFVTDAPNVILGPKEDAGIVEVARDSEGHRYGIVISHESHNHPSQIVPYEGAATGVGGNVRDVACMGARVIAVADSLRFGDIARAKTRWIHDGVVSGIGGYGNPLGIPNIGGDVFYDAGYNDNCLVVVVTLGVVRDDEVIHSFAPKKAKGYDLILVGKPTDNSGFGGASFASLELNESEKGHNKGAVQEPNAFLERHLLKATYALFSILKEQNLIDNVGFKDLGAGGIACASVELADGAGYGAEIDLENARTSMTGLHPSVILCSETQERFMWVASQDVTPLILELYNTTFDLPNISRGACASVIGRIRDDKKFVVRMNGEEIVDAKASDVTKGLLYDRAFSKPERMFTEPDFAEPESYNDTLLKLLGHENIASRAPVYERYDKQVQGSVVIEAGSADAGVMTPFNEEKYPNEIRSVGIALSTDHNPLMCAIDPYWGAVNAVVESMRNVAAVGATPQCVTDCLCFGSPEKPEQMWEFVEATRGLADACRGIHLKEHPDSPVPIVAGNVSFYNESSARAIPPSPMVSCLGRIEDADRAATMHFKKSDSRLFLLGERRDELGGSIYYAVAGENMGANVPHPDLAVAQNEIFALTDAIADGRVLSCHDISEGGVAVALAEMSFANEIGCEVMIPGNLRADKLLFGETGGFVLEIAEDTIIAARNIFEKHSVKLIEIGQTTREPYLRMNDIVDVGVPQARRVWSDGLRSKL